MSKVFTKKKLEEYKRSTPPGTWPKYSNNIVNTAGIMISGSDKNIGIRLGDLTFDGSAFRVNGMVMNPSNITA